MPTLFDKQLREKQIARLAKLQPDTKPAWGKLDARNLLPHLADPIRVGLGEYKVPDTDQKFFKTAIGRWMAIFVVPQWPKSPATAAEFDFTRYGRKGTDFEKDKKELFEIIERFGNAHKPEVIPQHPVFGKMTWKAWGHLMNKHIEHHCRQFGL